MRIGELAQQTGVSRDTLRFYERLGLIQARRSSNSYRDYDSAAVLLVNFIRRAQALVSCRKSAGCRKSGKARIRKAECAKLAAKLSEIDVRILQLAELKQQLSAQLMQECPLRNC
jgi:DNA-binding transcriptional MerR regulator